MQYRSLELDIMSPIEEEATSSCVSDYGSDADDAVFSQTAHQDPAQALGENLSIIGATIGYIQDNFFDHSSPPAYNIAKDLFGRWIQKHLADIRQLHSCTRTSNNTLSALCEPLHRHSPERFTRFKPEMPDAKSPDKQLLSLFTNAEKARQGAIRAYRDLVSYSNYPLYQILGSGLHSTQYPHAGPEKSFVSNFEDLSIVGHYISTAMLESGGTSASRYTQIINTTYDTERSLHRQEIEAEVVNLQALYWNPKWMSYGLIKEQSRTDINSLKLELLKIIVQHVSQGCGDSLKTINSIFELGPIHPLVHTRI
jgi:hypothetical protein